MGDRANIVVRDDKTDTGVFLYTHWAGTELPMTLRNALARNQRWSDTSYLTRIIFCEMVKGEESEETGFGISTKVGDGEDRILIVDVAEQRVYRPGKRSHSGDAERAWTFTQYAALTDDECDEVW